MTKNCWLRVEMWLGGRRTRNSSLKCLGKPRLYPGIQLRKLLPECWKRVNSCRTSRSNSMVSVLNQVEHYLGLLYKSNSLKWLMAFTSCCVPWQGLKAQPEGGESPVLAPPNCMTAFCRWCSSIGLIRPWHSAFTRAVCSQVCSGWDKRQHLCLRPQFSAGKWGIPIIGLGIGPHLKCRSLGIWGSCLQVQVLVALSASLRTVQPSLMYTNIQEVAKMSFN